MGRGLFGNIRPPGKGNERVEYRTGSCELRMSIFSSMNGKQRFYFRKGVKIELFPFYRMEMEGPFLGRGLLECTSSFGG